MSRLTPDEERLAELLRAGGTPEAALEGAVERFLSARAAGEQTELGPFLVAEGLVSVSTVQGLLSGGDGPAQQPHAHRQVELPALPEVSERMGEGPALPEPERASRESRRSAKRDTGRRARKSARVEPTSARDTGRRQRRSARAPASEELSPEGEERTARFDPAGLAAASQGESERLRAIPEALHDDERTRAFDADALAARHRARKPRALVPALAAGLACALFVGWAALREEEIEPLPPPLPGSPGPEEGSPVTASPSRSPEEPEEPEGGDATADLIAQAEAHAQRGDYLGALATLRRAPPELRARQGELLGALEAELESLQGYEAEASAALNGLDELSDPEDVSSRRDRQAAIARAEAVLESATERQRELDVTRRLAEHLRAELAPKAPEESGPSAQPPGHDHRQEPPERRERFASEARQGARVVAAMRAAIDQARAKAEDRRQAISARVRALSEQSPLDLELGGVRFQGAKVSRYDERGFSLEAGGNEVSFEWTRLAARDPQLALLVRRLALRPEEALDQLELGRWCLVHRLWDAAQDAFRQAVLLDARLKSRVPDVGKIARSSQVFRGRVVRLANSLALTYDFHLAAHNADWTLVGGARGGVDPERGTFAIQGTGLSLASLREVGWERELFVGAQALLEGPTRNLLGITFRAGLSDEVSYLVGIDLRAQRALLLRRQNRRLVLVDKKPIRALKEVGISLACSETQLEARVDGTALFRVALPTDWGRTRVLLGGSSGEREGAAAFSNLNVTGTARRDWIRKAFGAFEDNLRAYLARTDELEIFAQPSGRGSDHPLSAEDEWGMLGVGEEALAHDRRGRVKFALGKPLDLLAAANAFERAAELAPSFAAALYRRALALERLGRPDLALRELREAQARCPNFYEAMAAEARVLARDGELEEALAKAQEALRIRPDSPSALSARALVFFRRGQLEETRELLDLALALDPHDDEVRAFRRNVTNVLRGPPWEQTHVEETVHYRVLTDISQVKGRAYAEELEVIREFYAEVFGVQRAIRSRPATVLIFDTEEGFQAYADLTTDDRVESLLGYYLPRYDQLLLYEGRDDASGDETRRVLYHEAFHQFIHPLIPDLPYWVNEGLADYFSATKIEGSRVVSRGGVLSARLRDLRRYASEHGRPLSPSGLMRETPSEFYSGQVEVKYAQAWSMVHFFLQTKEADYRERFVRYLTTLRQGEDASSAYEKAFQGMDWKAFERSWWGHVRALR